VLSDEPAAPLSGIRPDVPLALESVVSKALAKDRELRHATVSELAQALEPFGRRSQARAEESRWQPFDEPLAPRPTPAGSVAAAAPWAGPPAVAERSTPSATPVCSVRIRARSDSDITPAPRVRSIEIPGARPRRAPLMLAVVTFAALAGYVSARWPELGSDAVVVSERFGALKSYLVELSAPVFETPQQGVPAAARAFVQAARANVGATVSSGSATPSSSAIQNRPPRSNQDGKRPTIRPQRPNRNSTLGNSKGSAAPGASAIPKRPAAGSYHGAD
jgi:serine/threonine-protein kinase